MLSVPPIWDILVEKHGGVGVYKNILVVYKKNFEEVHDTALATVRTVLDGFVSKNRVRVDYTARETVRRADFVGPDLVIVLGGDGTLTSIAHSIDDETPIMGVNSHPRMKDSDGSYGFYMGSDPDNFEKDIKMAMDGKAIVNVLPRLQAEIVTTSGNKILTDPALNDLLVANTHQYQPSKYRLQRLSEGIDVVQQ